MYRFTDFIHGPQSKWSAWVAMEAWNHWESTDVFFFVTLYSYKLSKSSRKIATHHYIVITISFFLWLSNTIITIHSLYPYYYYYNPILLLLYRPYYYGLKTGERIARHENRQAIRWAPQVQRHRQLQQHAIEQRQAKGWAWDRNWPDLSHLLQLFTIIIYYYLLLLLLFTIIYYYDL